MSADQGLRNSVCLLGLSFRSPRERKKTARVLRTVTRALVHRRPTREGPSGSQRGHGHGGWEALSTLRGGTYALRRWLAFLFSFSFSYVTEIPMFAQGIRLDFGAGRSCRLWKGMAQSCTGFGTEHTGPQEINYIVSNNTKNCGNRCLVKSCCWCSSCPFSKSSRSDTAPWGDCVLVAM